ncbi:MAG: tRNA lysidine(34) synthetase TilS, partial [Bacteroidota bacterium]
ISLLNRFLNNLQSTQLFNRDDRILVATSGGIDSMVLCELCRQARLDIGLAHCNFQLRGAAADADAALVAAFAKSNDLPYFEIKFDTTRIAAERRQSIQLVARDLRYEWLEEIRSTQQYNYIATAHHLNDSVETVLYNLTKGTGIRGLHGIPAKNGYLIRPLLFAERQDIVQFQQQHQVPYREDESNESTKYSRNKIRHDVIPELTSLNPAFVKTMEGFIGRMQDMESLLEDYLAKAKASCWQQKGELIIIDWQALSALPAHKTLLYELLAPMGFHADQLEQLWRSDRTSGAQFFSHTHRLVQDREQLWIEALHRSKLRRLPIGELPCRIRTNDVHLTFELQDSLPEKWPNTKRMAFLNFDKLRLPLKLRRWQAGDEFQPLGME